MILKYSVFMISLVICFFSLYTFSNADIDGRLWRDLPKAHPLNDVEEFDENPVLRSLFVFPEDSFDMEETKQIIHTIDFLPNSLLSKINNQHIHLKLFNGSLTDNQQAADLRGETPRGYKNKDTKWDDVPGMGGGRTVFIKIGASEKGKGHGSVNLELHELAHSVDRIVFDQIREDGKFLAIWREEAPRLFPNNAYFIDYPEEYFAECFAMYYHDQFNRGVLLHLAPKTFHYIERLK
ncbi:anthrax toxin lethal factor-related metalloendopeptidase [Bacillus massiliglaciei]|uniref:anthrax toxin lethal factor-related metalloendopeptidase n=1 Tax=Bacillus massiliglaciei TaxID=1816693 RepID=UPI000A94D355|nr:toxin [Bacillus massiliglaciei]